MDLGLTALLAGGGMGILYSMKSQITSLLTKFKSRLVYTVNIYQYDELFLFIERWLYDKHQKSYRDVEACFEEEVSAHNLLTPVYSHEDKKKDLIYKQETTTFIITYNNKKIVINKSKEKVEKRTENLRDLYFRKYIISGIKARTQIDSLLHEIIKYNEEKQDMQCIRIHTNNQYGDWEASRYKKTKPINNVILRKDVKELIINDLDSFISSEDWYNNVYIPYKRGYIFYGPPGTGKTTLALSIASYTKRRIYCMNLSCLDDDSRIPRLFTDMRPNSILLIEDIDKIFSGRDNVDEKSKITFSTFLNCMDGAFSQHGIITIITTNHIDKLDSALIRTGRIDVKIEVPRPKKEEIQSYLSLFYNEEVSMEMENNNNLTMSDIQEVCLQNRDSYHDAINQIVKQIKLKETWSQ